MFHFRFDFSYVDDIDFFIGGLMESGKDGTLGPTFKCVIGKQFERFKIGDRFWYETDDRDIAFTAGKVLLLILLLRKV
jgi:peroxidase